MATQQHFFVLTGTSYCAAAPVYEYVNVEGLYGTTPEQEGYALYNYGGACDPTAAPAMRQDLMGLEEELSSNYLSLGVADMPQPELPVLAGSAPNPSTVLPTQEDVGLCQLFNSLYFDHAHESVYQIVNTCGHQQEGANVEDYAALAFKPHHGTDGAHGIHGTTPSVQACVAPVDLHTPAPSYVEPSNDLAVVKESRAGRARSRRDTSSSPPVTRRSTAKTETQPVVPGFTSCKRRNVQVGSSAATKAANASKAANPFKCPYCGFVQVKRRVADFRRHLETHTGDTTKKLYLCCGVPLFEAAQRGVPAEVLHDGRSIREFDGQIMVGGCGLAICRKDAYVRHLKNSKKGCFGDAEAWYQPGNNKSD